MTDRRDDRAGVAKHAAASVLALDSHVAAREVSPACDRCGAAVGVENGTLSWRKAWSMASRLTVRCIFDCDPRECDSQVLLSWLGDRRLRADLLRSVRVEHGPARTAAWFGPCGHLMLGTPKASGCAKQSTSQLVGPRSNSRVPLKAAGRSVCGPGTSAPPMRLTGVMPKTADRTTATRSTPVYTSEGQRLLHQVPGSLAGIGERLGVSKQAIAMWRSGERGPGEKLRTKVESVLGIPRLAWDRLPKTAQRLAFSPVDAAADADDDGETDDEPSLAEDFRRQLRSLRAELDRPDLIIRERLAINASFSRALEQRRKYELQIELQEARFVRDHPAWQRFKRMLMDALLAHPAAARDVERVILEVLGSEADDARGGHG